MKNKICLVRPGKYPEGLIIPLGLIYIAGHLRKHLPKVELSVIDAPLEDLEAHTVAERIKEAQPFLVGLTGLSFHTPYVQETARAIRKVCPETVIVVGGAGVTSDPKDVLDEPSIDFGVLGEGEETFFHLVKTILEEENPKKIDGLAYRDNEGKVIKNSTRDYIENPSDIPIPAYDLLDIERYFKSPKRTSQSPVYISKRLLPILTSRGCPFKCIFCHDTLGKTFRSRTPEDIIEEISFLKKTYAFEELEIIDDIFNFDINHAKAVTQGIIDLDLKLKIAFPNGIKYEMIDSELLQLFKKAGVYRLAFGIESGDVGGEKIVRKKK
ncbi:uncharacterized protein METZ01_LOCUS257520, partial [marine metagenome]